MNVIGTMIGDDTGGQCPGCPDKVCLIESENFTYGDGAGIGTKFEKLTGTSEIFSNKLRLTTAGAIVRCTTVHPAGLGTGYISVTIDGDTNDGGGVLFNVIDSSNFIWAMLLFDDISEADGYLALGYRKAGTDFTLAMRGGYVATASSNLRVWLDPDGHLTATINDFHVSILLPTECDLAVDGHAGLQAGTVSGAGVSFDGFRFERYRGTGDVLSTCQQYSPGCTIASEVNALNDGIFNGYSWEGMGLAEVGTWGTLSTNLYTSSNNAMVTYQVPHPDELTMASMITASVTGLTIGDQIRLLLRVFDASNYVFAELTVGASGTLKIYKRVAGVNTQLRSVARATSAGITYPFSFCWSYGRLTAVMLGTTATARWPTTLGSGAAFVGVGTGTVTDKVGFTSFTHNRTYSPTSFPINQTCSECTVDSGCTTCCGTFAATALTVNLGAGGLTDDLCNACDEIAGEYELEFSSDCKWDYLSDELCQVTYPDVCGSEASPPFKLLLFAEVIYTVEKCYWRVTVGFVSVNTSGSCYPSLLELVTVYETPEADTTVADCDSTGPWTLTKVYENWNMDTCSGTLPATITMSKAA